MAGGFRPDGTSVTGKGGGAGGSQKPTRMTKVPPRGDGRPEGHGPKRQLGQLRDTIETSKQKPK